MSEIWTLEEDEELLTVSLPRKIYDELKALGNPRKLLKKIMMDRRPLPPLKGGKTLNIDTGPQVNISLPIHVDIFNDLKHELSDYPLQKVINYLWRHRAVEPIEPEPPGPNFLGLDI